MDCPATESDPSVPMVVREERVVMSVPTSLDAAMEPARLAFVIPPGSLALVMLAFTMATLPALYDRVP